MENKKKICKGKGKYKDIEGCGVLTYIFSNGLCLKCLNKHKTTIKKDKKYVKPIKYFKKPTGELELFNQIWNSRPHVSQISGQKLFDKSHKFWINQFMHVRGKGADPSNRLNRENIILATWEEHYNYDFHKHKVKDKPEWRWVFELFNKIKSKNNE